MKIVIAPDSFKESLSAAAVAAALAAGVARVLPQAEILCVPLADGGEGTLQALTAGRDATRVTVMVNDALGAPVAAQYGVLADGRTAVIEIAEAIGLDKVPPPRRSPLMTSSHGVGQLITACLDQGLRRLLIGLGGSATVDGGAGMLAALGARFLNSAGLPLPLPLTGGQLADIAALDLSGLDPRLAGTHIEIACDVDNPLCGERGAAAVFGPQKGANAAQVMVLDEGLRQLYALLQASLGRSVTEHPGAGAAGGLGAALLLVLGAELRPGVEVVMDALGLERLLAGATLVVTGEGRVDAQTLSGKAPAGVARLARRLEIPVVAVGGSLDAVDALRESGLFDAIEAAVVRPCSLAEALRDAEANLIDAGIRIGMWLRLLSRV
jgi:glycerate kinase